MRRAEFEILFGGSRGPGKTDAGIVWMMKPIGKFPRYRGLVIRRNAVDLSDWVDRARFMYRAIGGRWFKQDREFRFPGGEVIRCGHLKDDNAYERYQGHEYQRILIEELTQIKSEENYIKLQGSCRSTVEGLRAGMFCTTNPGGIGHGWVKARFVDVAPWGNTYWDPADKRSRVFIHATIDDNPTMTSMDPGYVNWLNGLKGDLHKAWRLGSWDVFVGLYFTEFDNDLHTYDPMEFEIVKSWPRIRSIDWGFSSPMACYWHAIGPDNHVYTYREYYEREKLDAVAASEIRAISDGESINYTIGDPQSFPMRIASNKPGEMYAVPRSQIWADNGISITMGNSDRLQGWTRMRHYLRPREYMGAKSSWWHISRACPNLIRELSGAVYDKKRVEDISGECSDHALESCRLGMMSRPELWQGQDEKLSHYQAALQQHKREHRSGGGQIGAR